MTGAATRTQPRPLAPFLLAAPATLLFVGLILLPLALTAVLSFNVYDYSSGVRNQYTTANYLTVLQDPYYLAIFWRTLRLALLTTVIAVMPTTR